MRVVVLTTSYPRSSDESAGAFIRDAVEALREHGVDVEVVSPASFRHFGIAYGHGVVGNLRRAPWKVLLLPPSWLAFARAARRAARDADLVHAHWLPSGLAGCSRAGRSSSRHGAPTSRWRGGCRGCSARCCGGRVCSAASDALAATSRPGRARGARRPQRGRDPGEVGAPDDPPHVLYVGRLSEEKGVLELVEASRGLPLVVVGDGPLRDRVPGAAGFVPPAELGAYLERAAVVACPSRREGYGVVARQAMAYGRPVVATAVGGLAEAVVDGETGLVVRPRDPAALRAALERLLGDGELRERLGANARLRAFERFGVEAATRATIAAYERAIG